MSDYFMESVDRHEYEIYEQEILNAHQQAAVTQSNTQDTSTNNELSDLDVRRLNSSTMSQSRVQPPVSMRSTGGRHGSHNTGSKGVQADYQEAKQHMINKSYRNKLQYERQLQQSSGINLTPSIEHMELFHDQLTNHNTVDQEQKQQNSEDDIFSDDDDDELMNKLRSERMQHIQNQIPVYGTYERINLQQFSTLVKSIESFVYCVAHLYSNSIQACTRLNLSFESLAQRFTHVKFVRIRIDDAIKNYNINGLPTLLVYKNNDMIESAVRITDVLPAEFTDYDVACLLQSKSILKVPTGEYESKQFEQYEKLSRDRKQFVLSKTHKGYDSDE